MIKFDQVSSLRVSPGMQKENSGLISDSAQPVRVAVVCPSFAKYDAIGASARDTYRLLGRERAFEVEVLTFRNDYSDVSANTVHGIADLLLHPAFLAADIIIYHFGIYSDLFDALIAGNGRAFQVVRFHNVTPPQHVAPRHRAVIERSFLQAYNLRFADELWADSEVNAQTLLDLGIDQIPIKVIPLAVDEPAPRRFLDKSSVPVNLLFIGRFVQSKGVIDLIQALDLMRGRCTVPFRLQLAGNLEWSDPSYLKRLRDVIATLHMESIVQILGTVSPESMQDLYHEAHILAIPSYHEGFCKPVIEALRAGCIPVGYAAHNLPAISNGLGRMVPPGGIHELSRALGEVIEGVAQSAGGPEDPVLPLDRGKVSARTFDRMANEYVESFAFDRLASATLGRLRALSSRFKTQLSAVDDPTCLRY